MTELVTAEGYPTKDIALGDGPNFQDLVSKMNLIALILNASAKLTFCNDYFLALTGWTRPEVLGCDWFQRFVPTGIDDLRDVFSALLKNYRTPGIIRMRYCVNPERRYAFAGIIQ